MSINEHEILSEVLRCTLKINKQWGAAPYAMYYESVTGRPVISSEEIVPRLVNILESGYAMSIGQRTWSDLGTDRAWEKELEAQKNLRTFSIEMLLSLSALCQRAGSWGKVFTIMEHYLQYLVPKKVMHNNVGETLSDICSSILVQATSQFAQVMFESAFDIFLLVSYLLNISGQVSLHFDTNLTYSTSCNFFIYFKRSHTFFFLFFLWLFILAGKYVTARHM